MRPGCGVSATATSTRHGMPSTSRFSLRYHKRFTLSQASKQVRKCASPTAPSVSTGRFPLGFHGGEEEWRLVFFADKSLSRVMVGSRSYRRRLASSGGKVPETA